MIGQMLLTADFGKGFTETNLKYMRQFYFTFPIRHALRDELSWTHYCLLLRIETEEELKRELRDERARIEMEQSLLSSAPVTRPAKRGNRAR